MAKTPVKTETTETAKTPAEIKRDALKAALNQIERAHGKGAAMLMGSSPKQADIDVISTGSLSLDIALGIGGLPRGRIVELYGPPSAGKSTLCLHLVAEAQKAGGQCVYIDTEHALDPGYARKLGVRVEDLVLSQPDNGEQALEIADAFVRSGAVDVVIVNSVAALVPRAELEGEMGDVKPGAQARLMSQAMRKMTASIAKSNTLVVFINQIRMKIGVMYGNPETTSGGNALPFAASIRLDIRKSTALKVKGNDDAIGSLTRVKVVKNKMAPPFKQVEFDILFGSGICKASEILNLGVKAGVLKQSGSHISFGETKLGAGRDAAKQYLKDNVEVAEKIEAIIRANTGLVSDTLVVDPETGEIFA